MATKLTRLRSDLKRLQRRRAGVRLATAFSPLLLAVLWAGVALFVIDWLLEMSKPQRGVAIVIAVGAAVWAFRRYTRPLLGLHETEVDVALSVERLQGIDSDLVSALQFESPAAADWGSLQLETAVVDHVADFSSRLNVFENISYEQLSRRCGTLAATILVLALGVAFMPGHASAFLNRLLMGSAHYPTRTVIEQIVVNGKTIFPTTEKPIDLHIAYGKPLSFDVRCSGELPDSGTVVLKSQRSNVETDIELVGPGGGKTESNAAVSYRGALPRMVDSVTYQMYLGDAWTDPVEINVIPLPVVAIKLKPTPPKYAAAIEEMTGQTAAGGLAERQISVIEGSRVDVRIECRNKQLTKATLTVDDVEHKLTNESGDGHVWALSVDSTPFASVTEPIRYSVQVEDTDGLSLDTPIKGSIRIKADRAPRVAAAIVSRRVLPSARPRVAYGATDDYGIALLRVHFHVARINGESEEFVKDIEVVPPERQPQTVLRGTYSLDLSPLKLVKGEELKVVLEAFDYRGELPPKSNVSEPLILHVTDREGILAGLLEIDQRSARQLDAIIQRELGIGDAK